MKIKVIRDVLALVLISSGVCVATRVVKGRNLGRDHVSSRGRVADWPAGPDGTGTMRALAASVDGGAVAADAGAWMLGHLAGDDAKFEKRPGNETKPKGEQAVPWANRTEPSPGAKQKVELAADKRLEPKSLMVPKDPEKEQISSMRKQKLGDIVFVDRFVIVYWSIVFLVVFIIVCAAHFCRSGSSRRSSQQNTKFLSEDPKDTLSESIWSLNLVAALGQGKFPNDVLIRPWLVFILSCIMAMAQLFTIFLIVDSMNPDALPITTVPLTPWKKPSASWTVNCMKWLMVAFLGMSVTDETADALTVFRCTRQMDNRRLPNGKWPPLFTSALHYIVTMGVVIGGVSVVLSCQDVSSILYNAMAITFINNLDDVTYTFLEHVFELECDFKIVHMDLDGDGVQDFEVESALANVLRRFLIVFPVIYAMFLIGRAWYTNQMPSVIIRILFALFPDT